MTEYEQIMAAREALRREVESGGVEDLSQEEDSAGSADVMKARQMQDQNAMNAAKPQQDGTVGKVGAGVTTAGMATGQPEVAAAGLALQTFGAVDSAVRSSEQAKIDAYNKKIMAQRSAIRNIFA
jgi:hypothetical protein